MKKAFLAATFLILFIVTAPAQTNPVKITSGFFSTLDGVVPSAQIETDLFTLTSSIGGFHSPWNEVCFLPNCRFGQTFVVPRTARVWVGGCVGCSGAQLPSGTFTINGTTYQNAHFRGYLDFSQQTFQIPFVARRKGSMKFRKPFTLTGHLQVCEQSNINSACPQDKILFENFIDGHGTVTATMVIRTFDNDSTVYPYLFRKNFEYKFEE